MLSTETKIHLGRLVFDKKKAWGQIRCLSPSIVSYYFQQLLMQGAPDVPPYVPLKKTRGLFINFPYISTLSSTLFSGGKFIPLGGQHISAALVQLRHHTMKGGVDEAALPISLQYIKATVYSVDTPLPVCRAIAGHHQSTQHDVKESTVSDALSFIMDMAVQKKAAVGVSMLTDEELYETLVNFGAVRGSDKSLSKTREAMTLREDTTNTRQQV